MPASPAQPPDETAEDRALGAALRRRREATGLMQQHVAAEIGMAPTVLGRIESGSRPCRAVELRALAAVLGTDPTTLLTEAVPLTVDQLIDGARTRFRRAVDALAGTAEAAQRAVTEGASSGYPDDAADLLARVVRGQTGPEWAVSALAHALADAVHETPLGEESPDG